MNSQSFIPVIVGTDMNAYNMAISFHEEYGIHPVLIGKEQLSFTHLSHIPRAVELNKNLHDTKVFLQVLKEVASKYRETGKQLLLVGTNDAYVRLIVENAAELRKDYVFNYLNEALMNDLLVKSNFYKLCQAYGLPIPTTYFHSCSDEEPFEGEMTFPVIIKPSNGVKYYQNPFPGMQKVYKVHSHEEINDVISKIKASGYSEELIIQDYIPGDDSYMWDSVVYINSQGNTELVTYGQVVLQERTVTAIGNYTAVMTRYDEEMMTILKDFLEHLGYTGFANFDLKYDERDGQYKVFEVNIRQGRSSYYITACGHNMAKYIVDDVIKQKQKPVTMLNEKLLFTVVPKVVLKKFVKDPELQKEVKAMLREKKYVNPLFYKKDRHWKRKIYLLLRQINYYRKYQNNHW